VGSNLVTLNNALQSLHLTGMESTQGSGDRWDELKSNYARNLATGVELPGWAAKSFSPNELAVLGAIRDAAYKAPSGGICGKSLPGGAGSPVASGILSALVELPADWYFNDQPSPRVANDQGSVLEYSARQLVSGN
jgi:hypothetical protein